MKKLYIVLTQNKNITIFFINCISWIFLLLGTSILSNGVYQSFYVTTSCILYAIGFMGGAIVYLYLKVQKRIFGIDLGKYKDQLFFTYVIILAFMFIMALTEIFVIRKKIPLFIFSSNSFCETFLIIDEIKNKKQLKAQI